MAVRKSIATGNFLTAGTWGLVDATSYNNTETTTTALTTSYQTSSTFTPGAITVDGIAVKLSVRTGTTGTISVALDLATVTVIGTEVTINTADLPVAATADLNGGWHYFKFAAPVLLLAATAYGVKAKTSSASQISLFSTATTNWARALVTTTTGAPAAGDDLIVAGEYTGAGTSNSFTVTMDALAGAITDYGAASTSLVLPSLAICNKGSLTYGNTAATNYYLRLSGNAIVYSGGTLNIGTVANPMPRDSSGILNFDCGANVDFGLTVRNLGTFVAQGLSRTSGKLIDRCKLNTDEAANSTSLGVDTDTGWLDNDEIAVASTTRTRGDCEKGTLNGAAGASTLTVDGFAGAGGGLLVAHSGTSPTQAEVILLTRNVQIFGASATLQSYVDIKDSAQIDCDWVEFKWLGSGTALKRGITVATITGSFNMQYCSLHDFLVASSQGIAVSGSTHNNITFSNNVTFSINLSHYVSNNTTSNTNWTLDSNIFMYQAGSDYLVTLNDIGGTYTNNTHIGGNFGNFSPAEANATFGTFSNIIMHSGAAAIAWQSTNQTGTLNGVTSWRHNATGFILTSYQADLKITNYVGFGNSGSNISINSGALLGRVTFDTPTLNGDTTFATTNGVTFASNSTVMELNIINGDFGTVSGIKTAHTNDIIFNALNSARIFLVNTKLASAAEVTSQTFLSQTSTISSQKHDQTAGLHKTWKKYGTMTIDTGTVHTGSQSIKMTPNNASNKLESSGAFGGFKVAVANGATVTPTVYVYEDGSYNGARARLIVKRNDAMGISADTVLDTATAASDAAWEALTGTTAAVTDDGTLEFVIDCDGTAGNLFVDSFTVA